MPQTRESDAHGSSEQKEGSGQGKDGHGAAPSKGDVQGESSG